MNAPQLPATIKVNIPSLQMNEEELVKVLSTSLYPGADLASIKLVVGWCKAQNKDPMKRPVHIVPMQVKEKIKDANGNPTNKTKAVWRDVLMPGIGDYRTDAARTGEYAGIGEATFGPDITKELGGEPKKEWDDQAHAKVDTGRKYDTLPFTFPEWCEISVFRLVQGIRCEFSSGRVYFEEIYATAGNDTSLPNAMWKKRKRGQIEKCAEAMALRRAFPEVGAQPTADELEGKAIDEGVVIEGAIVERTAIQQPQAKSDQAKQADKPAEPGAAETSAAAGNPGDQGKDEKTDGKPMGSGQKRILAAKLKNASLNDVDLKAVFGRALEDEGWMFTDFEKVQKFITERSGGQ